MRRILMEELKTWKNKSDRKPLILRGARQVGKTWLLKEFGAECFEDVCYINFEERQHLEALFDGSLNPQRIIEQLSVYHGKIIRPQKTLMIFDEVQEMPRALTSLKYFEEEAPEYAICCAGSLLGVALHEGTSFPVGKVDFMDLTPLSFQEFLMANGEQMLIDYILSGNYDMSAFSGKMLDYLKTYFIVGGMPAAVYKWIDSHDYFAVEQVQKQLISAYENDFSKHAPQRMVEKIRYVWDSLPTQLGKENKKFVYGLVREGARAREYEDTLMWLTDAGIIRRTYCIKKPDLPLKAYADLQSFKVFILDIGLLRVASGLSPRIILEGSRIFEEFKGALTEQYVCQELITFDTLQSSYYWSSNAKAEVDFVFSDGLNVYPLEVKSGYSVNAKSLKSYIDRYHPLQALRTSLLPYKVDDRIINIPLYMLFALEKIMDSQNH